VVQQINTSIPHIAQSIQAKNFNKNVKEVKFKVGDIVLLRDITTKKGKSKKLANNYSGPYEIIKVVSNHVYKIRAHGLKTAKTQDVNVNRLKIYRRLDIKEDNTFDKLEDDEFYVDKIIDHKIEGKSTHYLVRWKGYDQGDDSWENEKNLDCPEKLQEYWDSIKTTPVIQTLQRRRAYREGNVATKD